MATEKFCFKDYLSCVDDKTLSKTRKKMNAKSHKKRVYGLDWGMSGPVNASGDGGAVGESAGDAMGMHNGAISGTFSANILANTQAGVTNDMKKENRRSAPRAMNLNKWLQWRISSEDEESIEEVPEKIERMLDSGITDPDEIALQVGIPVEDVISYIDDIESAMEPDLDVGDENPDDEFADDEFDVGDIDFSRGIADDDVDDAEVDSNEFADETDFEELDFNRDDRSEHDLDYEFENPDEEEEEDRYGEFDDRESEPDFNSDFELDSDEPKADWSEDEDFDSDSDDDFDDLATQMIDRLSDETVDEIDQVTGTISRWWRERVINPVADDAEQDDAEYVDDFDEEYSDEYSDEYEEEQEATARPAGPPKIDRARMVFQRMINQPGATRGDIIAAFVSDVDVTHSTAVSYYERLAKEAGLTKQDEGPAGGIGAPRAPAMNRGAPAPMSQQAPIEELPADEDMDLEGEIDTSGDPNRQGIIRVVDNAHLVYKRQTSEGTFEELWTYNIGSSMKDELKVRRAILAGTDIPQSRTQSEDGSQKYTLTTLGNAQLLHITGLPN